MEGPMLRLVRSRFGTPRDAAVSSSEVVTIFAAVGGTTAAALQILDGTKLSTGILFSVVLLCCVLACVGWVWLATVALSERDRALQLASTGAVLQHAMAHAVRDCGEKVARGENYECQSELQQVLGHELKRYLGALVGGNDFSATVKVAYRDRSATNGSKKLYVVFRNGAVNGRKLGEIVDGKESFLYQRIVAPEAKNPPTYAAAREVEDLPQEYWAYKKYAGDQGIRSVLGIALRLPSLATRTGTLVSAHSIVGFLSIDSPRVGAFDGMFRARKKATPNQYEGCALCEESQHLLALADSIATICEMKYRAGQWIYGPGEVSPEAELTRGRSSVSHERPKPSAVAEEEARKPIPPPPALPEPKKAKK